MRCYVIVLQSVTDMQSKSMSQVKQEKLATDLEFS